MTRESPGFSLLTGRPFVIDAGALPEIRSFRVQEVRRTLAEATARRTLDCWLWLAGTTALIAAVMLLGRWQAF